VREYLEIPENLMGESLTIAGGKRKREAKGGCSSEGLEQTGSIVPAQMPGSA
jgi:hypothetical protein